MLKLIQDNLLHSQNRMAQQANRKRSERVFDMGDLVYVKLQPYRQKSIHNRTSHKLAPKYYGPYPVIKKTGIVAFELKLPATAAIHLVFHVSQLKKHVGNQTIHSDLPTPTNRSLLQPQQIVDRRMVKRGNAAAIPFLVLWKNLPLTETTWEYADELCLRFPEFYLEDKVMVMEGALSQLETKETQREAGSI